MLLLYSNPFNFSDPNSLVAWNGWQNSIVWSWSSWSTVFAKHRCYLWIQGRFIYGPFCLTSKDLWCLWALNTEYPNRVHFTGISRSWPFAFQRRATLSWVVDQESSQCLCRKGQLTFSSFKTPPLPQYTGWLMPSCLSWIWSSWLRLMQLIIWDFSCISLCQRMNSLMNHSATGPGICCDIHLALK